LIPRITPRLPDNPGTFILKCETILHDTGLKLTSKLEEYWTKQLHPVALHYNMPNHTEKDYKVIAVDREEDKNKNKRLRLEEAWMSILNTLQPNGLNIRY
jgi:hypothetical protein